jgi:hypothetical protein
MKPTLNNVELKAALAMVVEQNGLDRTLHALANVAYERSTDRTGKTQGPWAVVGHILERIERAPAAKMVSPSTYEPSEPVPHGPGWNE